MSDFATIVSLFPLEINEQKPGLNPGRYTIPAAKKGDFEILVIGSAKFPVYMDEHRGSLKVPLTADEVAKSIVDDFVPTHLGYGAGAGAGLFWVPGKFTKEQIKGQFKDKLAEAEIIQNKWFGELVKIADDSWGSLHRHQAISDLQRIAAERLGMEREWMIKLDAGNTMFCPACGKEVLRIAAICSCGCILDEAKAKNLKFVKV